VAATATAGQPAPTLLCSSEGFEERVYKCPTGKDSAADFLDKLKLHFKAATGGTDKATAVKNQQQVTSPLAAPNKYM
jgi:hypothetical protein